VCSVLSAQPVPLRVWSQLHDVITVHGVTMLGSTLCSLVSCNLIMLLNKNDSVAETDVELDNVCDS
jgi:hypothetical protein